MHHFTIHDPDCDVPRLLQKIRDEIVERGPIKVFDMAFKAHWDGLEYVAEMTVYYLPSEGAKAE
jgi:hypothetical protein